MIKEAIKKVFNNILNRLPLGNRIVFESTPVYADNTRAVYDEMVRRGLHKKYKFYWVKPANVQCPDKIPYAKILDMNVTGRIHNWRNYLCMRGAKALISCNMVLARHREDQYAICLMHGALIKDVKNTYQIPEKIDEVLSVSTYLSPIEADRFGVDFHKIRTLGYPRNDILSHSEIDSHKLFPDADFQKLVYWMPTYRQHKSGSVDVSSVAMPILYNEEIAKQVNEAAKAAGVLVVVKPHFAQDVSRITAMTLSNLVFINDAFLSDNGIINYELLGVADALLTDYSSVYYDYLLLDRPIGLCWDDYEEYKAREGFAVDMDTVMAAGEKIYTAEDLCGFLTRLGVGKDALVKQRKAVRDLVHDHQDDRASVRVVDWILGRIEGE